jgi:hypothetical protein
MKFLHGLKDSIFSSGVEHGEGKPTANATSSAESISRPADNIVVICDLISLQAWQKQLSSFTRTSGLPTVSFQLPALSQEWNQSFSALADSYQNACGCTSGSFLMSLAVVAAVGWFFLSGGQLTGITLTNLIFLVLITVFAALLGKVAGLLWARWKLLKLASEVYDRAVAGRSQYIAF